MEDLSGKDLGRYHIVQALGEGGMASVYKAFDNRLERYVAVKVIRMEKGQDISFLKRFEREAKALARLNHPNIVHVNDYGEQDGVPYLVMDYLPGGTLKQKLGRPLPYTEAAKILIPMAHALHHAHQNGIVHRDVKPANVLLTASGQPMLSDFGIAKMLESEQTSELTGTGVGIGTPEYMAPEQGTGEKVDERADIYSLGVVFYELITGRKPFRADTPMAVVIKHISEPLPSPDLYVPTLPEEVCQVVFKALAKRPEDRYQTMELFAQALERLPQPATQSLAGSAAVSQAPSHPVAPSSTYPSTTPAIRAADQKARSIPLSGLLLGVVGMIVVLGLLGLCGLGVFFKLNSMGPAPTNVVAQSTTKLPQVSAAPKTDAPAAANSPATQLPTVAKEPTPSATNTEEPTALPTSDQLTVTGNGYTSVILANRDINVSTGDAKEVVAATLPSGIQQVMIFVTWDAGAGTLVPVATMPDGTKLTSQSKLKNMQVMTNGNSLGFMLPEPAAGDWKFGYQNVKTSKDAMKIHFMVQYTQVSQ